LAAKTSEFALIEALANEMMNAIFAQFPVAKISLKLSKPDILTNAVNVAVEFTREHTQ
jgi:dihydroneopterin aldolase